MSEAWAEPLLPSNQTRIEAALAAALRPTADPAVIRTLWSPWSCPERLLPWLAWALSVDEWDDAWREHIKRQVIAESLAVHRIKGTVAAVLRALAAAGFPRAEIDERRHGHRRNGSIRRDGWPLHGARDPFVYRVRLRGLVSRRQATQIVRILNATAPVRCHLYNNSLDFRDATLLHNAAARRDGTYTRGIAYG